MNGVEPHMLGCHSLKLFLQIIIYDFTILMTWASNTRLSPQIRQLHKVTRAGQLFSLKFDLHCEVIAALFFILFCCYKDIAK